MQKHQKEQQEPKHEQKVEKEDKNEFKPFKILPIIIELKNYVPTPSDLSSMQTTYLSGAASFAGSFEGPFNEDAQRLMGVSKQSILRDLNTGIAVYTEVTNIWFNDPCGEHGNVFAQRGISPTKAKWRPSKIEIFDIKVESNALAEKFFTNHLDQVVLYKAEINYETAQTTTSGWSKEFSQSLGRSANAGIEIKFISAGVTIETTQTTTIGQSQEFSRTVTLGSSSGIEVNVQPGQSIRAELTASLGSAKARVTYDVQLTGWAVVEITRSGEKVLGFYHEGIFPFNSRATVEQVLDINNYGKDYIQVFPWDPNAKK